MGKDSEEGQGPSGAVEPMMMMMMIHHHHHHHHTHTKRA